MPTRGRWSQPLLAAVLAIFCIGVGSAQGAEHPIIHHAGILRSVDLKSQTLVIDERPRLGPPLLTRLHLTEETVLIRVQRVDGKFRGVQLSSDQLKKGEYLVVRGVDQKGVHLAEMIWSLGPAD